MAEIVMMNSMVQMVITAGVLASIMLGGMYTFRKAKSFVRGLRRKVTA